MKTKGLGFQFRVSLKGIDPEVWRRIVVPASYSFWDLHVAIQDSMGWLDCHLHAFRIRNPDTGNPDEIGIPDDEPFDGQVQPLVGWGIPLVAYFRQPGDRADYKYDFGDGWEHEVVLEQGTNQFPNGQYPVCLEGARACPPEDCGGVHGYYEMLKALGDPLHKEHENILEWVGGRYDPAVFDPKKVRFDSPKERWKTAFEGKEP